VIWENLAEVRSLAIAKPWRGNGFGNILVDECCKDARRIGIDRVFALTYQVRFFERNGFGVVSKDLLPQRVWIVCANCPRFPDCDEVAVMRHLDAGGA
jgi:amino-acid N-acetyltransferase